MEKREFYFRSCDGVTKIHAIEWIPEGEVRGVLQICHGMTEHIDRYDEFAVYLAEPVADFISVIFAVTLFSFQFRKSIREMEEKKVEKSSVI